MRKSICLIILIGLLIAPVTAIAQSQMNQEMMIVQMFSVLSFLFLIFIFMIIPSILCGVAAKRKGLTGFGFFMLSLFFTPMIGFLAVIAFKPVNPYIERIKQHTQVTEDKK